MIQRRRNRRAGLLFAGATIATLLWKKRLQRHVASLRGQVVLITGGSRGLGLGLARAFGAIGCRVAICGRDAPTLERARASLEAEDVNVLALQCDVTDKQQVKQLVATVTEQYGQIDILVNNAVSGITVGPLASQTLADFEAAHAVLFWGVVYPTLAVLPQMRARHSGRIVTIGSLGGKVSQPHLLPYSSAKFAATGFSEGLRTELYGTGVIATTIVPGFLQTGAHLHANYVGQTKKEFIGGVLAELSPFVSMNVDRAARQIVEATAAGMAERTITFPATLFGRLYGVFPATISNLLGWIRYRLYPVAIEPPPRDGGLELEPQVDKPWLRSLIRKRRPDLLRLNQYPSVSPLETEDTVKS